VPPLSGIEISQVTADSRAIRPGGLFVAIPGGNVDGHHYIPDALTRGAAAIVGSMPPAALAGGPVPYIQVHDARLALAALAAAFYGFPSRQLRLVGVTGTDGKTTTASLIYQVLLAAGLVPGMVSTVGARIAGGDLDTGLHVTTPDAPDVQRYLALMAQEGCQAVVLEATSHGLHQGRVAACDFDVAVITNVTHEHLDYHGTWDAYLDAKAILFESLTTARRKTGQAKVAVLNADDSSYSRLAAIPADLHLSYGLRAAGADLRAEHIAYLPDRTTFLAQTPAGAVPLETRLLGQFNVYNCLAALGAGLALSLPLEAIVSGLAGLAGVDGRMERIERGQDFLAIVDFAHTPASLARALEAVRPLITGRVIAVFGSAGLRDVQKRGLMAETAIGLADYCILTAEDPRTESLDEILDQMAAGARRGGGQLGRDFELVPDRTAAIGRAVEMATVGDGVIVCGKGHERSMCFGTVEHPWRDQVVVAWAIEQREGRSTAPPPYWLPTSG
jgi:UDP-N-acetylmuramoyl-L-alanyl-D-glutamate--2,6-diaminopimelate ligase